jgi:hypothetical protein
MDGATRSGWATALSLALALLAGCGGHHAQTHHTNTQEQAMTSEMQQGTGADPVAIDLTQTVKREGETVYIADVPKPVGSVSSLAVLTAALQQRGEDVDYNYLMGAGGRAFRLQVNWCGSGPHAHFGIDCYTPAVEAMGYERVKLPGTHDVSTKPWVDATPEQQAHTRAVVKAEIDAGRTVPFSTGEDALLVGYEPISDDNPTGWLRRPGPHGGGKKYMRPIKQMPWALDALKRISKPVSTRQAAINAIRMAIKNAERSTVDDENLKTGFTAWQSWIDELEPDNFKAVIERVRKQMAEQGNSDADPLPGICNGNAWIHQNLAEARQEAAKYLRRIAPAMPESSRPHLLAAADSYERVTEVMSNDDVEGEPCAYEFVPYAFRLKDVAREWTAEHRALQRKTLIAALPHERAAVDALKEALCMASIRSENGKVWIDGELSFSPGDFASSVHGAQARILQQLGESADLRRPRSVTAGSCLPHQLAQVLLPQRRPPVLRVQVHRWQQPRRSPGR